MTSDEHALLVALWLMAEDHEGRDRNDGLKSGPVPFYVVTCNWRDIALKWLDREPDFSDLRHVRDVVDQLKQRRLDVNGLQVSLLAVDPSGIEATPVRLTLSTYVPMVIAAGDSP